MWTTHCADVACSGYELIIVCSLQARERLESECQSLKQREGQARSRLQEKAQTIEELRDALTGTTAAECPLHRMRLPQVPIQRHAEENAVLHKPRKIQCKDNMC